MQFNSTVEKQQKNPTHQKLPPTKKPKQKKIIVI